MDEPKIASLTGRVDKSEGGEEPMRAETAASNALVATKSSRRFANPIASSKVPSVRNARNF